MLQNRRESGNASKNFRAVRRQEPPSREQLERELRTRLMLGQLEPHFVCSVLCTIAALCELDAPRAKLAAEQLCELVRCRLDASCGAQLIPIQKEMACVRSYAALEQLRFGEKLRIIYEDFASEEFLLPALSVQPIVENAIRHGIGEKPGGGSVRIAIHTGAQAHVITVEDDGAGVDARSIDDLPDASDGRAHIGLAGVRARVRELTGGDVRFQSRRGRGTVVTILIPNETGDRAHADSCRRRRASDAAGLDGKPEKDLLREERRGVCL